MRETVDRSGDMNWGGGQTGSSFVVFAEACQLLEPLLPFLLGGKKVISHIAEKLDLHDVDFLHSESRNLGPRFVRVGVIVEDWRHVST
jgi:hypothetical protein